MKKFVITSSHIKQGVLDLASLKLNDFDCVECSLKELVTIKNRFGKNITRLNFDGCVNFDPKDFSFLPEQIEVLDLARSGIKLLDKPLPRSLKKLFLNSSHDFQALDFACLPEDLEVLNIGSTKISHINSSLPPSLKKLGLYELRDLEIVNPEFLPDKISLLSIDGCSSLKKTDDLVLKLADLQDLGCVVIFPKDFFQEYSHEMIYRIQNAIAKYKEANKEFPSPDSSQFLNLVKRFLDEDLDKRGDEKGERFLASTILPIAILVENNPNNFLWLEQISEFYNDACINQPVSGFSKICAVCEIASAKGNYKKIIAAKRLLAQDFLLEAVVEYFDKMRGEDKHVPHAIQVEIGNILLERIHEKLFLDKKITKKWFGLRKSTAYSGGAVNYIEENPELLRIAYEKTCLALDSSQEDLCKSLSTHYSNIWSIIAFFDDEVCREKKEFFSKKLKILMDFRSYNESVIGDEEGAIQAAIDLNKNISDIQDSFSEEQLFEINEFIKKCRSLDIAEIDKEFKAVELQKEKFLQDYCYEHTMLMMRDGDFGDSENLSESKKPSTNPIAHGVSKKIPDNIRGSSFCNIL